MKEITICVGIDEGRNIRIRLTLSSDGFKHFHATVCRPGDDLGKVRAALESHISNAYEQNSIPGAPWPKIPDSEWAEVAQIAAILHTPERVAKRIEADRKNAELFTGVKNDRN